jgi:hypothetical protein
MSLKEYDCIEASKITIRKALEQLASQTGSPYNIASTEGRKRILSVYCTFEVPEHGNIKLSFAVWRRNRRLMAKIDLADDFLGQTYWENIIDVTVPGGVPQLVKLGLLNLPRLDVIKSFLTSPKVTRQTLPEIVKRLQQGELSVTQGAPLETLAFYTKCKC